MISESAWQVYMTPSLSAGLFTVGEPWSVNLHLDLKCQPVRQGG